MRTSRDAVCGLLALLLLALPLAIDARPPAPTGARLVLRPICFVDPPQRAAVNAHRAALEAHEMRVAVDGSWIVYPEMPAAGYRVALGARTSCVQGDGTFSIPGSGRGLFSHPTDTRFRAPFTAGRSTYVWPVAFSMRGSPMGAGGCCPALAQSQGPLPAARVAAGGRFHGAAAPVAVRMGPRGSYPEPETPLGCLDDDGGFSSGEPVVDYIGSTCDAYVRAGVCVNEWPSTDREYNALRAVAKAAGLLDEGEFLSPAVVPMRKNACADNHKGRACQQLQIGDLSIDTGSVTRAGRSVTVDVEGGKPLQITVHNNGSTGTTEISKTRDDLGGSLDCARPLLHYDAVGASSYRYHPDREARYLAPEGREGTDTFLFQTDGRFVELNLVARPTPTPSPETVARDGQITLEVHAVARGNVTSHSQHFTLSDKVVFDMRESRVFRIRKVDPDWVYFDEISNRCTYKVTGGGRFANKGENVAWSYHVSNTTGDRGQSGLTVKIGTGHLVPALWWMHSSYDVEGNDVHAGSAPAIARDTIANWREKSGKILFTFNPGKASVASGKTSHAFSEETIVGLIENGTLDIEYTVAVGRLTRKGK